MTGDQLVGVVAVGLMLVLVGSSLVARRLEWPKVATIALAWAAIFVGVVLVLRLLGLA